MNPANSAHPVRLAMVCGRKSPADGDMQVCLLSPEQIAEMIDFSAAQQNLTVRKQDYAG